MNYFLKTERVGFKNWDQSNLEDAKKLWLNSNVTKYFVADGYSVQQVIDRFNNEIFNQEKYGVQYWPIYLLETDEFIGCCGLRIYDEKNNIYEFGVHILDSHWHNGYAYEAGTKIVEYAKDKLNASKLFAGHNPNNVASKAMLNKLGFVYSHDEYYKPTGLNHPSYFYYY